MSSRNRKGFTLIEVLVGLIILAVGLLAIAGMLVTSVKGNYFSNHLTQASYVAQDRLEFLKNIPIDNAALTAGTHPEAPVTISGRTFSRSYTVVVNGNLRTITYTVTWTEGINHSRLLYNNAFPMRGSLKMAISLKGSKGLSLIELLVALVMSSILIAAVYRTFVSQQKTYMVQEQVVDMQQNVRSAIGRMMREIRMAGFGNVATILPGATFGAKTLSNVITSGTPTGGLTVITVGGSTTLAADPSVRQSR